MEKLSNYAILEKTDQLDALKRAYEHNVREMNADFRLWLTRNFDLNEQELACIKTYPEDFWQLFGRVSTVALDHGAKFRVENINDTDKRKKLNIEIGYDIDDKRV